MKPLLLKMTAFGPYAKETTLNFKEDLSHQDIFVVTGPTGAGKTTIFDAICYALYGETSGGSRTGKELRSDFAIDSELKTEIQFTFQVKEKSYRITRAPQQLQKKKRGDGYREVSASVELMELESEQPPLTKDTEVKEQIQQIIGLKVEQFRKIVMIPQGDFKEFLYANTTNKEEILRKIFGTDLYKKIQEQLTQQANALKSEVAKTQQEIQAELKLINTDSNHLIDTNQAVTTILEMADSQQKVYQESVHDMSNRVDAVDELLQQQRTAYEAGKRLNEKFIQYEQTKQELKQLNERKAIILEQESQIQQAKVAQHIISIENERLKYQVLHKDTLMKKRQLEQVLVERETEFILVEKCYLAIDSLRQEIASLIEMNNDLSRYVEGVTSLEKKRLLLEQLLNEGKVLKEKVLIKEGRLTEIKQQLVQLDENNEKLTDLKQQQHTLSLEDVKLKEDFSYIKSLMTRLISLEQTEQLLENQKTFNEQLQQKAKVKREDYQHQAELFINAAAIRLANELKVGEVCPVCGSLDHPRPRRSDEVILSKTELDQLRFDVEYIEKEARQSEQELARLISTQTEEQRAVTELITHLKSRQVITNDFVLEKNIVQDLNDQFSQQIEQVGMRLDILNQEIKQLEIANHQLAQQKLELQQLEQQLAIEQVTLQEQRERYKSEERSKQDLELSIPADYRSLSVLNEQLKEVQAKKLQLEQHIVASEEDYQRVTKEMTRLKASLEEVGHQLVQYETQLQEVNEQFSKEIEFHFQTIEQYEVIKELMPNLSKLEQQVKLYYQELHTANKLLDMLTVELDGKERVDTVTLEHTMTEYERQKSEIIKERAVILANIEQNEMILKSVDKKYQTIQMKEKEYAVVGELDSLANGRSGGKMSFETFVLSSYFDEVLEAANERLQKMTARRYYLLRREEVKGAGRKGLDLDVYDSHTCKTRPVNTLSGGESFKASLALALGLSDTVQQNSGGIQLDTMFIDEGFGTLDSESLDQAIDILMELQDYGRLIGVISHVNELKERIPAKLVVETNGMGSYAYFKK